MGLTQYTAECTNWDFGLLWNDDGIDNTAGGSNELDVTTLLARFNEADRLKATLDLAKRLRLKPPQPRPRLCALVGRASRAAAQSAALMPPLGWQELRLQFHLGSQYQPPSIGRRTNLLHAKQSRRRVASYVHSFTHRLAARSKMGEPAESPFVYELCRRHPCGRKGD
jgi:hypothetical protein